MTSTFLTLIVVPIMYTLLMKEGNVNEADIESELADLAEERIAAGEAAGVEADFPGLTPAIAGAHAPTPACVRPRPTPCWGRPDPCRLASCKRVTP